MVSNNVNEEKQDSILSGEILDRQESEEFVNEDPDRQDDSGNTLQVVFERNIASQTDLMKISDVDLDFRMCVARYKLSGKFTTMDSSTLSKCIFRYLFLNDEKRTLQTADFVSLSKIIVATFSTELITTYYIPAAKGKKAKGKLWDSYNNLRTALAACKLIDRRVKSVATPAPESSIRIETSPNIEEDIDFLHFAVEPWDTIIAKWKSTASRRLADVPTNKDILTYMRTYPCLLTNTGYQLFKIDVQYLHSLSTGIERFPDEWANEILLEVQGQFNNGRYQDLANLIGQHTDRASRKILSLIVLPLAFPCGYSRKKGKKIRASKKEMLNCFVPYFETRAERDVFNSKLIIETKRVHPTIHVVGNFPNPIAIVTVLTKEYTVQDPVEAFEACFNSFFAFNLEYTQETKQVWLFAQKSLFNIHLDFDEKTPLIERLLQKLEN